MSTATRGPWTARLRYEQNKTIGRYLAQADIVSGDQVIAGVMVRPGLDAEANAQVLAAAPEMYEALRWLLEMAGYAQYQLNPEWRRKNGGDFADAIGQAFAAIAKVDEPAVVESA